MISPESRADLTEEYIDRIIATSVFEDVVAMAKAVIEASLSRLSDEELIGRVSETHPDLLDLLDEGE